MSKKYGFCTILNTDGRHLDKVSWQKALILLNKKHQPMMPIEFHDTYVMSAGGESFRLPKTMMVKKYVKHKARFTPSRRNIFLRDEYKCRYCSADLASDELTIDHILPRSRGGKNTWQNLATSCFECNSTKGNKTPEEAEMPLLPCPNESAWN